MTLLPHMEDPAARPYWEAARQHRLAMQQCSRCAHVRWPPRSMCPTCLEAGRDSDWRDFPQEGTIWSFVVYHRAFRPEFADQVPYNVALVKLDAGPVVTSNVVGTNDLKIGDRVKAVFDDLSDEVSLVKFELLGSAPA